MEEKERYVLVGSITVKDRETNDYVKIKEAVELLNQQNKRIKELKQNELFIQTLNMHLTDKMIEIDRLTDLIIELEKENQQQLLKVKQNQDQQINDLQHRVNVAEKALELACEEVQFSCPNPPERYNAQEEYGSDEPYWIEEGGCEFTGRFANCLECQIERFKIQAESELKGE